MWERLSGLDVRRRLELPSDAPRLSSELNRVFLGILAQVRVDQLPQIDGQPRDKLHDEVKQDYRSRLETEIRRGAEPLESSADSAKSLSEDLTVLRVRSPIDEAAFQSLRNFRRLVGSVRSDSGWRGGLKSGPLRASEAGIVAGIVLGAVQRVVLDTVSRDYGSEVASDVPPVVWEALRAVLAQVDVLARELGARPRLREMSEAQTELSVARARVAHKVWLPLRPIPAAPLAGELVARHYVGRPDEDAQKLGRQIRHAGGTVLVTGYRGVGKSSFVNRVLLHVAEDQTEAPSDGWLCVPVQLSLAKVAGVESILRVTLRAVRNALLCEDEPVPAPVPGRQGHALPLDDEEVYRLREAYARATWKVAVTRSESLERKWAVESSAGIDLGKALAPVAKTGLSAMFSGKASRTEAQKLDRQLSLLDYDENAAEEDLVKLIRLLARPRPFGKGSAPVRIKLVFVFDELDKMDDDGFDRMIEGLKNLFLQQYAVFLLVTGKKVYYRLRKDRAEEDAKLNSFFSNVIHVPLLNASQVREMLEDWTDKERVVLLREGLDERESELLNNLAGFLTYYSFGKPREIVRELRRMQDWGDGFDRPYLSDHPARLPQLLVFSCIQREIERLTALPTYGTATTGDGDSGLAVMTERLSGDEGRLEQVRRGLYYLTEELISRQTLSLDPADLKETRERSFSLLSVTELQEQLIRLGNRLSKLHETLPDELFRLLDTDSDGRGEPLFSSQTSAKGQRSLAVTPSFYALTGRRADLAQDNSVRVSAPDTQGDLSARAQELAGRAGWAERLAALGMLGELGCENLSPKLKEFVIQTATKESDPERRLVAAELLTPEIIFSADDHDLPATLLEDTDSRLLSLFLRVLAAAPDDAARDRATSAILGLLRRDQENTLAGLRGFRFRAKGGGDEFRIEALEALGKVSRADITIDLLDWLAKGKHQWSAKLADAFAGTLKANADAHDVDIAASVLGNPEYLLRFTKAPPSVPSFAALGTKYPAVLGATFGLGAEPTATLEKHLKSWITADPNKYAILVGEASLLLPGLFSSVWEAAAQSGDRSILRPLVDALSGGFAQIGGVETAKSSIRTVRNYKKNLLPVLREAVQSELEDGTYQEEQANRAHKAIEELEKEPSKPDWKHSSILERLQSVGDAGLPWESGWPSQLEKDPYAYLTSGLGQRAQMKRQYVASRSGGSDELSLRHGLALLAGTACFLSTLLYFTSDLPGDIDRSQIFVSRLLIWLICATVVGMFVRPIVAFSPRRLKAGIDEYGAYSTYGRDKTSEDFWQQVGTLIPLAACAGLWELHKHLVGPVEPWNAALVFGLNFASAALVAFGLWPYVEEWSD